MRKLYTILIIVLSLAVFTVNCGDVLTGGILDSNPNAADAVPLQTLYVAIQPITYGFYLGDIGIYISLWMQQMAGVNHQYTEYERYELVNTEFGFMGQLYMEGGLLDIKTIKERAAAEGKQTILGMTKLYEAMMFATGADVWGAIPYTEAATDEEHPKYDTQESVHNACLALLDGAISDLTAAQAADEYFNDKTDFSFGGDRALMIAAAHSLKARILLNWGAIKGGNYALALAEAQQGISSVGGNWSAPFDGDISAERNIYYQFNTIRGDNIKAGQSFVDMLKGDNDPRLDFYFADGPDTFDVVGSEHAALRPDASWFNLSTFGDPGWDLDLLTYEETQFIIAECQYRAGQDATALATLNGVLGDIETRYGLGANSIQRYTGLTGTALLAAIMNEKYKSNFLNPQTWNDWKRTGYPQISSNTTREIPRRHMYSIDEFNSNNNFPGVRGLYDLNANDPGARR